MKPTTREMLRSALFEAVFVVAGVVLALGANEWREARQQQRQAEAARAEIIAELAANRDAVAASVAYHNALVDSLHRYHRAGRTPGMQVFPRGFVAPAQVYETAWRTASETGALALMDYEEVLRFSRAYAAQMTYTEQARSVGDIFYRQMYERGVTSIAANSQNVLQIIYSFLYRESQVLETYETVLAEGAGGVAEVNAKE